MIAAVYAGKAIWQAVKEKLMALNGRRWSWRRGS